MYTSQQPKRYPLGVDVITPTGTMYIEWKALCVQLGVSKAKALLRKWEGARPTKTKVVPSSLASVGVFTHSSIYGCMDYWEVSGVRYRGSLVDSSNKGRPMEATWSLMKKALLYKLF